MRSQAFSNSQAAVRYLSKEKGAHGNFENPKNNFQQRLKRLFGFTLLLVLAASFYPRLSYAEITVPCVEGSEPLALPFGATTTGCAIDVIGDSDTFTFSANAGDVIRISMGDGSVSSASIDNRIQLFDLQQAGAEIGSVVAEVNAVLDVTVTTSGTFEIRSSDAGDNQAANYGITLQRLNAPGDVTPIVFGETLTDTIGTLVDIDAFGFTANAGDVIRISMGDGSVNSASIDNRIQLYDASGAEVGSIVNEVNAVLDVTLATSGPFLILASDAGGEQADNYGITLQRLNAPGAVTPIAFGETLADIIGTLVDIDAFGFTANAGDVIRISMGDGSVNSASIDNRIQLYDASGAEVGSIVNEVNAVLDVTLATSGPFLILASDAGGEQADNYGITLQRLNAPGAVTPIAFGETLADIIGTLVDIDAFGFTANAGDVIRISMGDGSVNSASIDNRIQLYDASGAEVGSIVNEVNAVLDVRVRSTGTYLILASDAGGEQADNYGITLQRLNAPGAVTPIAFGQTITDTIGTLVDIDAFGFTANAGDVIRISMGDGSVNSASIDNRIQLYDANGVEIGSAVDELNAVLDVTLGISGPFLILASDTGGEQADNYGITLQRLNAPGAVTPIAFGQTITDTIGTLVDIDAYGFTANTGDVIRISMGDGSASSASIDNRIQLYDPNGVEIGSAVDELNAVLDVTLGISGPFLILASDAGGEQAANYQITLECTGISCAGFNAAPVITNPGPQVNIESDTVSLAIIATDSDVLEYGATGLPAGLAINPDTGVISGTLGFSSAGFYNVSVTVSDNISAPEVRFSWTVNQAPPPVLNVNATDVYFGEVIVGASAVVSFEVLNPGTSPVVVSNIQSSDAAFTVLPPGSFTVAPTGFQAVNIEFTPTAAGDFAGTIALLNNTGADVIVNVLGRGLAASSGGDIDTVHSLQFSDVEELVAVEQVVPVINTGEGLLTVSGAVTNDAAFTVATTPGDILPLTLNPGETRNLLVRFTAPAGAAGTTVSASLDINSDDVDEAIRTVALTGSVVAPAVSLVNNSLVAAQVTANLITAANCSSVGGEVQFSADSSSADSFKIILAHQNGTTVESAFFSAIQGAGTTAFSGINACGLPDGVVEVLAVLDKSGTVLPPLTGTPAVKNTGFFGPPVLDPVPVFSLSPGVEICGTSRADTTVRIEGGSSVVSVKLDTVTTVFCLDVPLRRNAQNVLIASAIDDLDSPPRDVATAQPVQIVQVDLENVVVANAFSRSLTVSEINALVADGVIDTNEAANFNVSMFTVVLTIGSLPVTISQPVVINPVSGSVSYGRFRSGGGISFGGWSGGGSAAPAAPRSGGCVTGCAQVVVITTASGQTIPGVIIIDGRIKTLKEFFQVGLVLFNNSGIFDLSGMNASVDVPGGLTPIRAGIGLNLDDFNLDGATDSVLIGDIAPGGTGIAQFLLRGDGIGRHQVDVDFDGSITGGGLPVAIPVAGSASTTVEVTGPPELGVEVSFPSNPVGDDVILNQVYTLTVNITNLSSRPALYTSLELFVGGDAQLLDENGNPETDSSRISTPATILPNQTQPFSFRIKSLAQGEIIACQAVASENILLTVDTGPAGAACLVGNTLPANFVPLPPVAAPTVIAINPLNGESNVALTSSVLATFTPRAACIVADTWTNVVTANIDPFDPGKGLKVVSADLVGAGTFYLEELDWTGSPVRHVPVDLTLTDPSAGGTTIAVLRLGLDSPHPNSQYFLQPSTSYRATIVGGNGGVCSTASGAEMNTTFSWTFNSAATCNTREPPSVNLQWPANGSIDRTRDVQITLDFIFSDLLSGTDFRATMDLDSFVFDPGDFAGSSFGVYVNAVESGGDITGGTAVAGTLEFSGQERLYFVPDPGELSVGDVVHVRVTDQVTDDCGNPVETPLVGVKLFKFDIVPLEFP